VKVFNTDLVLQRFLLAKGIELTNLISATKWAGRAVIGDPLLTLGV
jgi:hypothetical protein